MKNPILTILICLSSFLGIGAPVITVVNNNGDWSNNSTWDLNRAPQTGDTILIPIGKTVILTNNVSIGGFSFVNIYGTLKLSGGKLDLSSTGQIWVHPGGKIVGTGCSCEQIRIGNVKKYQGDPDVLGPQYATSVTIDFDPYNISVLPVKFESFTLNYSNKTAIIQWSTSEEINAGIFQVERSFNGADWNSITTVEAKGNSSVLNAYSYSDKNISARVVYYRIKEVDVDGKTTYTIVKTLKTELNAIEIKVASLQNQVLLNFSSEIKGNVLVQFISLSGQLIDQQIIRNPVGQVILNSRIKGNCIVSLNNDQSLHVAKQIIL